MPIRAGVSNHFSVSCFLSSTAIRQPEIFITDRLIFPTIALLLFSHHTVLYVHYTLHFIGQIHIVSDDNQAGIEFTVKL